jgi:hypothetical protein
MMRGEEAGLDDILADGWLRKIVWVTSGVLGANNGETGCCRNGDAFVACW